MKHSTKLLSVVFLLLSWAVEAQTNVHGGIYSSTTWTKANSPYIVVDTVVVFPGVTLTIEPGVTVKFADTKYMEIRQGTFVAAGTITDSITFTSNSGTPTSGIYEGIVFNTDSTTIDYCIFKYANNALNLIEYSLDTSLIQHSSFFLNNNCVPSHSNILVNQSSFNNNSNCFSNVSFINVKQSSFINNTNCIGDFNMDNFVDKISLDSCSFDSNTGVIYCGEYGHITNCIFLNNNFVFLMRGELPNPIRLIKNSIFCNNQKCLFTIDFRFTYNDSLINCNFSNNGIAVSSHFAYLSGNILANNDTALSLSILPTDSVFNNYIYHNEVGTFFSGGSSSGFFNNYICNNSIYNIIYTPSSNGSIQPVCFCDTDSATIRSKIYDGYVNIALGLLNFSPYVHCDSSILTSIPPINCQTVVINAVEENTVYPESSLFKSYPNPASNFLTVEVSANNSKTEIKIFNLLSEVVYWSSLTKQKTSIDVSTLANGMYIIQITTGSKIARQKFIEEKSIR